MRTLRISQLSYSLLRLPSTRVAKPQRFFSYHTRALPSVMDTARNYDEVLKGKYPAKLHAKKVAEWIIAKGGDASGTLYLEGQKQRLIEVRERGGGSEECSERKLIVNRTMMVKRLSGWSTLSFPDEGASRSGAANFTPNLKGAA